MEQLFYEWNKFYDSINFMIVSVILCKYTILYATFRFNLKYDELIKCKMSTFDQWVSKETSEQQKFC